MTSTPGSIGRTWVFMLVMAGSAVLSGLGWLMPGPDETTTRADAPASDLPSSTPHPGTVQYGPGFYSEERDDTGVTWRWTAQEAIALLRNQRRDSVLGIQAAAAVDGTTVVLELGGERLDEFVIGGEIVEMAFDIPARRLGLRDWTELYIETDAVLRSDRDPRVLGLRVFDITWAPR
jgi:hypothetical protein